MVLGSMVAFSGPAHAVAGELTVGPLAGNESFIDIGTGTIEVRGGGFGSGTNPWTTTDLDLEEAPGSCFDITINVPGDTISRTGSAPNHTGTEVLAGGAVITINGNGCGFTNGTCVLTLTNGITLSTSAGGWVNTGTDYRGTFRDNNMTQVGGFTIAEGTNCRASGLADSIWTALTGTIHSPVALPWSGSSTNILDVEFHKILDY